ncbi:30S ribosomal protein S26e [Candidatus Micrarchaeota archaeon]|nr:30S ribosomal protein S26e [Candidatus Micrarchaeota archaeon]
MAKKKRRGKETIVQCVACGARVPRNKAVLYEAPVTYSAENPEDSNDVIKSTIFQKRWYCISCAKHRGIFEKKKKMLERKRSHRR